MKNTGIVRKLDNLGRIVLPKETRKMLGINEGDPIEIFTEGDTIILRKYNPGCNCCGEMNQLSQVLDMKLCKNCIDKFNKSLELIKGGK